MRGVKYTLVNHEEILSTWPVRFEDDFQEVLDMLNKDLTRPEEMRWIVIFDQKTAPDGFKVVGLSYDENKKIVGRLLQCDNPSCPCEMNHTHWADMKNTPVKGIYLNETLYMARNNFGLLAYPAITEFMFDSAF